MDTKIGCRICGAREHFLLPHLQEAHDLDCAAYLVRFPGALTVSAALAQRWESGQKGKRRQGAPDLADLQVDFGGVSMNVKAEVPASACLPMPSHYRFPQFGDLANDIADSAIALACGRSLYIHGPQGTGKDAVFHAYSHLTRTPAKLFQVPRGVDISHWFFTRKIAGGETSWEEGEFMKAVVKGYTTHSGEVLPYLILVSDFDRADKSQAESLRLVLDSIQGRIMGPNGKTYNVLPGTQVVATANTSGGGDVTGRYISANPIDGSIMDRFGPGFEFHAMAWADEEKIVRDKFPLLVEKCPGVFKQVGMATQALRAAVASEDLYCEFSHRAVCGWLQMAEDIIRVTGTRPASLLKRAARAFLDKLPDKETREEALRLIDPALKGGSLDSGASSFNESGDLLQ